MSGSVPAPDAPRIGAAPTDHGGRSYRQGSRDPGGHEIEQVIQSRGGPPEAHIAFGAVSHHGVQRVGRPITEQTRHTGDRSPQQGSNDGIRGVLRQRLHAGAHQIVNLQSGGIAGTQVAKAVPRAAQVIVLKHLGHQGSFSGQAAPTQDDPRCHCDDRRLRHGSAPCGPM